jgi:hypothetical protein
MSWWEWDKMISFEEIKDTHPQEFSDDADMISIVKTILQMDAFSSVSIVLRCEILCIVGVVS